MCMYIHIYNYIDTDTGKDASANMYTCICMYMYVCVYIYICVCVYLICRDIAKQAVCGAEKGP